MKSLLIIAIASASSCFPATAADFYVATNGNDAWSGMQPAPNTAGTDGPFATLERARDEIRKLKVAGALAEGGVSVELRGGLYQRPTAFELTAEDSGTAEAPIVYRARTGEEVRLVGGRTVTNWRPVTGRAVLNLFDESARGKVLQADLRASGITNFGQVTTDRLELFFQDRPMTLARWPNDGFVRIADVLGETPKDRHGRKGTAEGVFSYDGDRPRRWVGAGDAWLHGYWFWDWAEQRQRIQSIDSEKRVISLAPPDHHYGYRKGQWYYAFNLLSELDVPGEWYLDREAAIIYFLPPAPVHDGMTVVSVIPSLVSMEGVSHVTLQGLTLEVARGTAITINGGTHNRIVDCTIRNVGDSAVRISGGNHHTVAGCDIHATGAGGLILNGGDRRTLIPGNHLAENNHIHDYGRWQRMYTPAIRLNGVGNRAVHNLIHDAPHQAIAFAGNDHVIEYNEIHDVCTEANDAGAIYSGRDWTWRGTVIRYNYLHDIAGFENRGCIGVYLDDMLSGTEIYGNIFDRVTRATFIGGGRDNRIENNVFVNSKAAVHVDARALGWAGYHAQGWINEAEEKGTLSGITYNKPPYRDRYPALARILQEEPTAPRGTVVARNIQVGGRWDEIEAKAQPFVQFVDNLLDLEAPFTQNSTNPYELRKDSRAYSVGFKRIPFDEIGLYSNEPRPSGSESVVIRRVRNP